MYLPEYNLITMCCEQPQAWIESEAVLENRRTNETNEVFLQLARLKAFNATQKHLIQADIFLPEFFLR